LLTDFVKIIVISGNIGW